MSSQDVIWTTAQEIAARDGMTKQGVAKMVRKYTDEHGDFPVQRDSRGRVTKFCEARYDLLRGQYVETNSAPTMAETLFDHPQVGERPQSKDAVVLRKETAKAIQAELQLRQEADQLIRADHLNVSLQKVGRLLQREVMGLSGKAEDIALAASRDGERGTRLLLDELTNEICARMSDILDGLAVDAPDTDEMHPQLSMLTNQEGIGH